MSSKLQFLLIVGYLAFVLTVPMIQYNNAQFHSTNSQFLLTIIHAITMQNDCMCHCYANPLCITGTFFGINQTCVLFSAYLQQAKLSLVSTNNFATTFSFPNRTILSTTTLTPPCSTSLSYTDPCNGNTPRSKYILNSVVTCRQNANGSWVLGYYFQCNNYPACTHDSDCGQDGFCDQYYILNHGWGPSCNSGGNCAKLATGLNCGVTLSD